MTTFEERLAEQRRAALLPEVGLTRYQHIERLGNEEIEGLLDGEVIVQNKIDGCLHYRTKVYTDSGEIPIGVIVKRKLSVQVLSVASNGKLEFRKILRYQEMKHAKSFVRVRIEALGRGNSEDGNRPVRAVWCTFDHLIFTSQHGWIEANKLSPGDTVLQVGEDIPSEAKEMILGCLLGDASIARAGTTSGRKASFAFVHSTAQSDYFDCKMRLLGGLLHETVGGRGGFLGSKPNRRACARRIQGLDDLIVAAFGREGKAIGPSLAKLLTPISIAFWYMDDGSCAFPTTQRPRARLAINGFSMKEAKLLSDVLMSKFGLDNKVFDYKGPTIVFTADSTEYLFDLISPYICRSMRYKIGERWRSEKYVLDGVAWEPFLTTFQSGVLDVSPLPRNHAYGSNQYDLTVEANANYIANGVVVHNSNLTVAWYDDPIGLVVASRNNVVYRNGSYVEFPKLNQDKTPKLDSEGNQETERRFVDAVEYVLRHGGLQTLAASGFILRGEWLLQHSAVYAKENYGHFYLFDVQRKNGEYLHPDEWIPMAIENGIRHVSVLAKLDHPPVESLLQYVNGPDEFGAAQKEGIVIKRPAFVNKYGRTTWGKLVAKEFKEKMKAMMGATSKDPPEIRFAARVVTFDYVVKTIRTIEDQKGHKLVIRDMPEVLGRTWHDAFVEELWDFVRKENVGKFDFKTVHKIVERKVRDIALAYFNGVPTVWQH